MVFATVIDRISPLAYGHEFRLLLGSMWMAATSQGILLATGPLLVASLTSSPSLVAMAGFVQWVPMFLFGFFAGMISDRLDRRRIIVISDALRIIVLMILSVALKIGCTNVWFVLSSLFAFGVCSVFSDLSFDGMIPAVVPERYLGGANSRSTFAYITLCKLVGPPLGAALYSVGAYVSFAFMAILFAGGIALIAQLPHSANGKRITETSQTEESHTSLIEEIREALSWLWSFAPMRTMWIMLLFTNMSYGATNSVLVLYVTKTLGLSEHAFGLYLSTEAVGGITASLIFGHLESRWRYSSIVRSNRVIQSLAYLVLAVITRASFAYFAVLFCGFFAVLSSTVSRTIRHSSVPVELRGRVTSIYFTSFRFGSAIGAIIGGAIGSIFGIRAVYFFAFATSSTVTTALWKQFALTDLGKLHGYDETTPLKVSAQ